MAEHTAMVKVGRNGQITLPSAVRRAAEFKQGDLVAVTLEHEAIVLTPMNSWTRVQAYFYTEAWQKGEREASRDISQDRLCQHDDFQSLIQALKAEKA